ncbi:succinate dehydrogenase, hydrophobic membrane anchor protein [Aliiroseovarius sp.]|uniref:succinate dehydrogenase, hydrophobic membrane anchor protein n=1 Tax=Aliiroseovarius sp. TaxID=1872442 RepID=UPI003BABC60E
MRYLTDRKRATGLGSGRAGTHHHWQMMVSSAALVVLVPLFVITFGIGLGGSFEEVQAYYARPFPALITALTLIVGVFHLTHEAQAAVEDYMHGAAQKLTLIGLQALAYVLITTGLFALARMAL